MCTGLPGREEGTPGSACYIDRRIPKGLFGSDRKSNPVGCGVVTQRNVFEVVGLEAADIFPGKFLTGSGCCVDDAAGLSQDGLFKDICDISAVTKVIDAAGLLEDVSALFECIF